MLQDARVRWEPLRVTKRDAAATGRPLGIEDLGQGVPAERPESFTMDQFSGLVRRLFTTGQRGGHRHITFTSLADSGVRPEMTAQIGKILAKQASESVCLVEADPKAKLSGAFAMPQGNGKNAFAAPLGTDLTVRVARNLWLCPADRLLREDDWVPHADVVRNRMARLRREFGYMIVHAPGLGAGEAATLMGQLTDGIVLVMEANVTRRITAAKACDMLKQLKIPIFGAILDQRTFPVPESLYRKL
jgi:hypothetical protein